jgi:hypothetical protein
MNHKSTDSLSDCRFYGITYRTKIITTKWKRTTRKRVIHNNHIFVSEIRDMHRVSLARFRLYKLRDKEKSR